MQVQLYYNPKSGSGDHNTENLAHRIQAAGHQVKLKLFNDEINEDQCDVVAIAGGDGTVEKVVQQHYRKLAAHRIPVSIIPIGTANNIARSLDIAEPPRWLMDSKYEMDPPKIEKKLSIGVVQESASERYFLESIGFGVLAELIRKGKTDGEVKDSRQLSQIQQMIQDMDPGACELIIDGRDYSNHYVLMEIMNIHRAGPGLALAPDADPGDSYFRVVLVAGAEKDLLTSYLTDAFRGARPENRFFRVTGRHIKFSCPAGSVHIDDQLLSSSSQCRFAVQAGPEPLLIMD